MRRSILPPTRGSREGFLEEMVLGFPEGCKGNWPTEGEEGESYPSRREQKKQSWETEAQPGGGMRTVNFNVWKD